MLLILLKKQDFQQVLCKITRLIIQIGNNSFRGIINIILTHINVFFIYIKTLYFDLLLLLIIFYFKFIIIKYE